VSTDGTTGNARARYLAVEISKGGGAWDIAAEEVMLRVAQMTYELGASARAGAAELSILLADDEFVRTLNRKYRHQDKPTNVLSFPQTAVYQNAVDHNLANQNLANQGTDPAAPQFGSVLPLGDIVLAYETLVREAHEQHKTFENHLAHLVAHGVLHLMGYDHEESEEEAEEMEAMERAVLARFDIADPYAAEHELEDMPTGTDKTK